MICSLLMVLVVMIVLSEVMVMIFSSLMELELILWLVVLE